MDHENKSYNYKETNIAPLDIKKHTKKRSIYNIETSYSSWNKFLTNDFHLNTSIINFTSVITKVTFKI